jgi:hypothetical protein
MASVTATVAFCSKGLVLHGELVFSRLGLFARDARSRPLEPMNLQIFPDATELALPLLKENHDVWKDGSVMTVAKVEGERERVLKEIRGVFQREPRINLHKYLVRMEFSDGVFTLEGEAEHIGAKKLSMELAAAMRGVSGIVDRLHVTQSTRMEGGAIVDAVRDALLQEVTSRNCSTHLLPKGRLETVWELSLDPHGAIRSL